MSKRGQRKRKAVLCAMVSGALLLQMPGLSYAEKTQEPEEFSFDQIVVTATKTEKKLSDVAASVSVITEDDIKKLGVTSVDQALIMTPGVYIPRLSGMASTISQTGTRGLSAANSTLIMVDGQPLNDSYNGSVTWSSIPIDNVKRIEVVRGPASTLYGSSAMGGVINIITKNPEKTGGTASIRYGSNNSWDKNFDYNVRVNDKFSVEVLYENKRTDGYITDNAYSKTVVAGAAKTTDPTGATTYYIVGDKGKRQWDEENTGLKLRYQLDPDKSLQLKLMRNDYKYTYSTPSSYVGANVYNNLSTYFSQPGGKTTNLYSLNYVDSKNDWNINAGFNDTTDQYYTTLSSKQFADNPNSRMFFDVQKNFGLSDKDMLTTGLHYSKDKMRAKIYSLSDAFDSDSKTAIKSFANGDADSFALYARNEHVLNTKWSLATGLRFDRWSTEGDAKPIGKDAIHYDEASFSQTSPSLSLQYKPDNQTTTYLSWGKAFEAPTLYRMYSTSYSSGSLNVGNPELKPQTIDSIELGVKRKMGDSANVAVSVYHNDIKDLLYKKTLVASGVVKTGIYAGYAVSDTITRYENVGRAEANGFEIEYKQRLSNQWSGFANYTYQNPVIKEAPSAADVNKLATALPKEVFRVGMTYIQDKVTGTLTGEYVSKRYSSTTNNDTVNGVYQSYDPYFIVNLNLQYDLNKDTSVSLGVENLLNRQYYNYYYAPDRSYSVQLNYKF
ncbi:MAG: TonB-dependent receptor [Firmicutes bacterium]|nr:TonB-dependent receptor [Bacillota bacterium]